MKYWALDGLSGKVHEKPDTEAQHPAVKLPVPFFGQIFVIVLTGALSAMRKANVNMMRRTSVERAVSQELMAARAR
jgi:hypothetical protein